MKKQSVFEFNGEKYRVVSSFGDIVNAKVLKSNGRAKMGEHCTVFKMVDNKPKLFDAYNQKLIFN